MADKDSSVSVTELAIEHVAGTLAGLLADRVADRVVAALMKAGFDKHFAQALLRSFEEQVKDST